MVRAVVKYSKLETNQMIGQTLVNKQNRLLTITSLSVIQLILKFGCGKIQHGFGKAVCLKQVVRFGEKRGHLGENLL